MLKRICCVIFFIVQGKTTLIPYNCDQTKTWVTINEGNLGETGLFPWLGVIRVHLHEGGLKKIALTGMILIKEHYGIANAGDIAKIPKRIFRGDSRAMFLYEDKNAWYCNLKDYITHPEYDFSSRNTIAIVELDLKNEEDNPLRPICWPPYSYNTSNELFAVTFTDENRLLEKSIYRMQYLNKTICEEFYKRASLADKRMDPTYYQCVYAVNNTKKCDFDNGLAIVSNSTGVWILIGFGLSGPGCALPSRFIEIAPYLPWIEASTTVADVNEYPSLRKNSAFSIGFRSITKKKKFDDVPAHALTDYQSNIAERRRDPIEKYEMLSETYPFKVKTPAIMVYNVNEDTVAVRRFRNVYEKTEGDCKLYDRIIYRDNIRIVETRGSKIVASYKLSLFDLEYLDYSCITIKIQCYRRDDAKLWFTYGLGADGEAVGDETPGDIIKTIPIPERPTPKNKTEGKGWKPNKNLRPVFITDTNIFDNITSLQLYIHFDFIGEGKLVFEVYGPKREMRTTPAPEDFYLPVIELKRSGSVTKDSVETKRKNRNFLKKFTVKRKKGNRTRHGFERVGQNVFANFPYINFVCYSRVNYMLLLIGLLVNYVQVKIFMGLC